MACHLLDVIGRPAAAGDRKAAIAESMHPDRKIGARGGFVDRPIAAIAEWLCRAAEQEDLDEIRVVREPLDLGNGRGTVLIGGEDRRP